MGDSTFSTSAKQLVEKRNTLAIELDEVRTRWTEMTTWYKKYAAKHTGLYSDFTYSWLRHVSAFSIGYDTLSERGLWFPEAGQLEDELWVPYEFVDNYKARVSRAALAYLKARALAEELWATQERDRVKRKLESLS